MAAMITRAWLNWNAHRVQLSLLRKPMNPHAGCTTQNQRNRVYPYAGHGLTTRGTVEVAPIWWVFVSAAGALMPFMVAACPNKHTRGIRDGQASPPATSTHQCARKPT